MRRAGALASVAAGLVVMCGALPASAATITVEIEADEYADPVPIGTEPVCSLREAVEAANTDADFDGCERVGAGTKDTIVLTGGITYVRTRPAIDDTNVSGDLDIVGKTTFKVTGSGKATIDGNSMDRVIQVLADGRLRASRLIVTDGVLAASQSLVVGAGILNQGTLNLRQSEVTGNVLTTNSGCPCGGGIGTVSGKATLKRLNINQNGAVINLGGGVYFGGGEMRLLQSTVDNNYAERGGGIALGGSSGSALISNTTISNNEASRSSDSRGGGMYVTGAGADRTLENVTVSGNYARTDGGGIYRSSGGLSLNAVTITDNTADVEETGVGNGGGISNGGAGLKLRNSIVAGNHDLEPAEADCAGTDTPAAHNLVGIGTGCVESDNNEAAADPRLKPLGDYGGLTLTHALKGTSPAIGKAGQNSAPARDQRLVKRDDHPDIGAYER